MGKKPEDCEFGKAVKKRLVDLDMRHVDLARQLKINPGYLGFILQGRRAPGKYRDVILQAVGLCDTEA